MSGELEAAGAMATAGLAAGVIEGREAHAPGTGACLNCAATLSGPYCSQCGQAAHAHRTLWHLLEEVLHGLFHFDTKAWRTLPMLAVRPGTLTHDYIHGKRARYISPLALFLFTIFFMFFVFSFVDASLFEATPTQERAQVEDALADQRAGIAELEAGVAERRAARGAAPPTAETAARDAADERALSQMRMGERILANQLARIDAAQNESVHVNVGSSGPDETQPASESAPTTWQEDLREAVKNGNVTVGTPFPELNQRILHSLENPDLALYKVQQAAYKFSFLLVPISLPFLWLLFLWRRGHTLYDHAVLVLYSLSFASLVFVVAAVTDDVPWLRWLGGALFLVGMPVHMFFQLKGAYSLGWWSATWRTSLLLLFAVLSISIFFVLIILMGLGG